MVSGTLWVQVLFFSCLCMVSSTGSRPKSQQLSALNIILTLFSGFHFPSNPFHFRTLHLGLWQVSQRGEGEMGTVAAFTVFCNLLYLEMERGDQFLTLLSF